MSEAVLRCSFCNKPQDEVLTLIASPRPGVFICDECTMLSADIVAERRAIKRLGESEVKKRVAEMFSGAVEQLGAKDHD